MKLKFIISPIVLLTFMLSAPMMAQGYQSPSRQLVQTLLERLDECKKDLTQAEKEIGIMENNPGEYSLETYLFNKKFIKELKACIKWNRDQLETLRKDYPGWFNSSSAFADIRVSWPRIHSPVDMDTIIERMETALAQAVTRFEVLDEPKD